MKTWFNIENNAANANNEWEISRSGTGMLL